MMKEFKVVEHSVLNGKSLKFTIADQDQIKDWKKKKRLYEVELYVDEEGYLYFVPKEDMRKLISLE